MKALRFTLSLLALATLPIVASAQGRAKGQTQRVCTPDQQATVARALAAGRQIPPGLEHCASTPPPPPPPPSEQPPTGVHSAVGTVYEDVDGDGVYSMFAGEFGLAGWTVQLFWSGRVIAEAVTDGNGSYSFANLGNTTYEICVVQQPGYVRTQPTTGGACGGAGYLSPFNNDFGTQHLGNFGMMLQQ